MAQSSFDFSSPPVSSYVPLTQQEIDEHNQRTAATLYTPALPPGSLSSALDAHAAKTNAVYMLRGMLARQLRGSLGASSATSLAKRHFLKSLKMEINIKKTGQNAAVAVRHILMETASPC